MATEAGKVLELVVFTLRAGTSREELLDTVDAVSSWIVAQPGFVSRSLVEDSRGRAVDRRRLVAVDGGGTGRRSPSACS